MRWLMLVAAVALAGCGGSAGDGAGAGGSGGDQTPCYSYMVNPDTGERAQYCTSAEGPFCWWTGRDHTDSQDCAALGGQEVGCVETRDGWSGYFCALYRPCDFQHIDNDPCCDAGTCG
jgi:hypothetical protein